MTSVRSWETFWLNVDDSGQWINLLLLICAGLKFRNICDSKKIVKFKSREKMFHENDSGLLGCSLIVNSNLYSIELCFVANEHVNLF